jgi:hypothetical protein
MATGTIDSSTLYELIHLFRVREMTDTSAWTWRCSTEVTNLLIHGRQLSITRTPKLLQYPGFWGYIQQQLADQTDFLTPSPAEQKAARSTVNEWVRSAEGTQLLRKTIADSFYDTRDANAR